MPDLLGPKLGLLRFKPGLLKLASDRILRQADKVDPAIGEFTPPGQAKKP